MLAHDTAHCAGQPLQLNCMVERHSAILLKEPVADGLGRVRA